jgi:hypothetical protein
MYYIYHIYNRKIGCTIRPKQRIEVEQSCNPNQYEILEIHNDINIASNRERELQIKYNKLYGYSIDKHLYSVVINGVNCRKAFDDLFL